MIDNEQTTTDMVTIENFPKDNELKTSFGKIIEKFVTDENRGADALKEWLEVFYGNDFFFYRGGSHIAIHERNKMGEPMEERLIMIEL